MGDLIGTIMVDGEPRRIKPIERRLVCGNARYALKEVCKLPGGLIVGEGDSGKSIFVKMLKIAAEARGPVKLVLLRKRENDFSVPCISKGKIATVIFDGLDEYPECARDILDFMENVDERTCHVWVTSRPVDAASCLQRCPLFAKPYHLEPFERWDVRRLAEGVSIDPHAFLKAVEEANLNSFLTKPGGAILMLDFFARGRLKEQTRLQAMDEIVRQFVRESRDGHTLRADEEPSNPQDLIKAAQWIAAYLMLSGHGSVWCGDEGRSPRQAVPFNGLLRPDYPKTTLSRVLGRRIFEPLSSDHLRFTYSDTLEYLAGSWMAERVSLEKIKAYIPTDDSKVNSVTVRTLSWAGARKPELCQPWIGNRPEIFFSCHDAIHKFGCERYFRSLVHRASEPYFFNGDSYWHEHVLELDGYEELAEFARKTLKNKKSTPEEAVVASFLLRGYHEHRAESAEAIVGRILVGGLDGYSESWMADSLAEVCGGDRPPFLVKLKGLLKVRVADIEEESFKGHLLHLLWPKFLSEGELKGLLVPLLEENMYDAYTSFLARDLKEDFGLKWVGRLQKREHGPIRMPRMPKIKPLPAGFLEEFLDAVEKDPEHVRKMLVKAEKEELHPSFCGALRKRLDLQDLIRLFFFITRQKDIWCETNNIRLRIRLDLGDWIPRPPSDDIMRLFWDEAKTNDEGNLGILLEELEESYYEDRNTLRLTAEQIDALANPTAPVCKLEPKRVVPDWSKWPKRWPRFKCDVDGGFANVVDEMHTGNRDYPRIEPYLSMPESAQIAIRLLLSAAAKRNEDEWWIRGSHDGKSFSAAFQKSAPSARRFFNDQIEVGTNRSHKGQWRILPDAMFPARYRKNYPKQDPLAGS